MYGGQPRICPAVCRRRRRVDADPVESCTPPEALLAGLLLSPSRSSCSSRGGGGGGGGAAHVAAAAAACELYTPLSPISLQRCFSAGVSAADAEAASHASSSHLYYSAAESSVGPASSSAASLSSLSVASCFAGGPAGGAFSAALPALLQDAALAEHLELLLHTILDAATDDVAALELWTDVCDGVSRNGRLGVCELLGRWGCARRLLRRVCRACFGVAAAGVTLADEDAFDASRRSLSLAVSAVGFLWNARLAGPRQVMGFVRTMLDGTCPHPVAVEAAQFAELIQPRAGELAVRLLADVYSAAAARARDPRSRDLLGHASTLLHAQRYVVQAAYRTVQVSGIDVHATEHELLQLLRRCGELVRLRLCGDRKAPCVSGHFVFKTAEGAERLMAMDGERLGRMRLKTTLCTGAVMGKAGLQGFGRHRKIRDTDLLAE